MVHEHDVNGPVIFCCAQSGCEVCLARLLSHHEGLIHTVIRRSWLGCAEYADLLQEGRIALWRAICGFDPERNLAFSTYACRIIERQVWQAVARSERQTNVPPLPWPAPPDPELSALAAWQATVVGAALAEALRHLPLHAQAIIRAAYGLDGRPACSLAAIGRRYGVTRERARQWRNDALLLLRLPAITGRLRVLTDRSDRQAYRRSQQLRQRWLRQRRGRGR